MVMLVSRVTVAGLSDPDKSPLHPLKVQPAAATGVSSMASPKLYMSWVTFCVTEHPEPSMLTVRVYWSPMTAAALLTLNAAKSPISKAAMVSAAYGLVFIFIFTLNPLYYILCLNITY